MGYREKERDGEQDTGIESTQEQQGHGAREKTGTESRTEKWKRKIRDGYKHREEKNAREHARGEKKKRQVQLRTKRWKRKKQRWAAGQRQRMTKRKEREQDKNAGRKRKGSGRTRERKRERKREQDRRIERRGEVQGSKENHSSVGKRGGQGRDREGPGHRGGATGPRGPRTHHSSRSRRCQKNLSVQTLLSPALLPSSSVTPVAWLSCT